MRGCSAINGGAVRGHGLFADGFTDTILFGAEAVAKGLAYVADNPLYKPGGQCAAGNLLMLAPAGWPYLPGEKKITRMDACALNRIAQLLAGTGAVEINYRE